MFKRSLAAAVAVATLSTGVIAPANAATLKYVTGDTCTLNVNQIESEVLEKALKKRATTPTMNITREEASNLVLPLRSVANDTSEDALTRQVAGNLYPAVKECAGNTSPGGQVDALLDLSSQMKASSDGTSELSSKDSKSSSDSESSSSKDGKSEELTGGEIAGIVVGILALLGIGAVAMNPQMLQQFM